MAFRSLITEDVIMHCNTPFLPLEPTTEYQKNYINIVSARPRVGPITADLFSARWLTHLCKIQPRFICRPEEKEIFKNLSMYFSGNVGTYDLDKSIYLYGPPGTGKTLVFRSLQNTLASFKTPLRIVNVPSLVAQMMADNHVNLPSVVAKTDFVLDDAGAEGFMKVFGTDVNLVADLVMLAYEKIPQKMHITTNLTPDEMSHHRGFSSRQKSRMNEMYNIVRLCGADHRIK